MNKKEELQDLYKRFLASIGIVDLNDGYLSKQISVGEHVPYMIQGRRVTLPLDNFVRNASPTADYIVFHPMSENVLSGQSHVIRQLRVSILRRLNDTIAKLSGGILVLLLNTKDQSNLSSSQVSYLNGIGAVDEKSVTNYNKILDEVEAHDGKKLINIYLRRAGSIGDVSYKRKATVTFPIYNELTESENGVFGITTLRKRDITTYIAIFNKILPDLDVQDQMSGGSNSNVATYFHALMIAFYNVAKVLNVTIEELREPLKALLGEDLYIDVSWFESLNNLNEYRDLIPPCPFNVGDTEADDDNIQPVEQSVQPQPMQPQYPQPTLDVSPVVSQPQPTSNQSVGLGVPTNNTVANNNPYQHQTQQQPQGGVVIDGVSPEFYRNQYQQYQQYQAPVQYPQQPQYQQPQYAPQYAYQQQPPQYQQQPQYQTPPPQYAPPQAYQPAYNTGYAPQPVSRTEQVGYRRSFSSQNNAYYAPQYAPQPPAPQGPVGPTGLPVFK